MKIKCDEVTQAVEDKFALEKEKKEWIEEREKMKERIKKLKSRKGKIDVMQKVCKNCAKDYIETENFNWSCRIHQGSFSGEIWWCCGKEQKDAPGCKYSKHESKEDEELLEDAGAAEKIITRLRCLCCKEAGHLTEHCPRDPNLRSAADTEEDYERIQKIKDYRKLNADTVLTTTHFLKKCLLVPTRQTEQEERTYQDNPFKRGSMKFDDFNYQMHNPYILVKEEKDKKGKRKPPIMVDDGETQGENKEGLSSKKMEIFNIDVEPYEFKSISVVSELPKKEEEGFQLEPELQ